MKRSSPVLPALVLLLLTACSGGRAARTAVPSATPLPAAPTSAPATATASPVAVPAATPDATAAPAGFSGPPGRPVPQGLAVRSVTFVSARTGWALGSARGCTGTSCVTVVRTRDGGATWQAIGGPRPAAPGDVAQLRFADLRDGFVTGSRLWATHDGGGSWQVVPGLGDVNELEAAAGRVWALREGVLLSAPVTGGAFVREPAPAHAQGLVVHGGDVFVRTSDSSRLYRGGHGRAFAALSTPCSADDTPSLGVADDQRWLLVCAGSAGAGHQDKRDFRTTDGGRTWSAGGALPPVVGSAVQLTSDGDFVVDEQQVSVSRDGDRTWTTSLRSEGGLLTAGFESAALGFALGGFDGGAEPVLRLTHDGGRTWAPVAF